MSCIIILIISNVDISRPAASYSRKVAFPSAIDRSATIVTRTEEESNVFIGEKNLLFFLHYSFTDMRYEIRYINKIEYNV